MTTSLVVQSSFSSANEAIRCGDRRERATKNLQLLTQQGDKKKTTPPRWY